jgi:hypothetical protein
VEDNLVRFAGRTDARNQDRPAGNLVEIGLQTVGQLAEGFAALVIGEGASDGSFEQGGLTNRRRNRSERSSRNGWRRGRSGWWRRRGRRLDGWRGNLVKQVLDAAEGTLDLAGWLGRATEDVFNITCGLRNAMEGVPYSATPGRLDRIGGRSLEEDRRHARREIGQRIVERLRFDRRGLAGVARIGVRALGRIGRGCAVFIGQVREQALPRGRRLGRPGFEVFQGLEEATHKWRDKRDACPTGLAFAERTEKLAILFALGWR